MYGYRNITSFTVKNTHLPIDDKWANESDSKRNFYIYSDIFLLTLECFYLYSSWFFICFSNLISVQFYNIWLG